MSNICNRSPAKLNEREDLRLRGSGIEDPLCNHALEMEITTSVCVWTGLAYALYIISSQTADVIGNSANLPEEPPGEAAPDTTEQLW